MIGDRPLDELVPLYRDPRSDMPVTQFNMKYVELAGLVKFDFLGLKTLTVLARARRSSECQRGVNLDLANLPLDDPATYELLGSGETVGVFQLEGAGMRDMLKKLRPDRFEDIIAVVALYRPGPMENIPRYIEVKHRPREGGLSPSLARADPGRDARHHDLPGTGDADRAGAERAIRSAAPICCAAPWARRSSSEMEAQRRAFIDGATARGVAEDVAEHIFEQVEKFAGYGFNKSHAAAYALVAYQTAYLKANHPVEFMAASMSLDIGNTDKLNVFRQECSRLGIRILPPDINRSKVAFAVEADARQERPSAMRSPR